MQSKNSAGYRIWAKQVGEEDLFFHQMTEHLALCFSHLGVSTTIVKVPSVLWNDPGRFSVNRFSCPDPDLFMNPCLPQAELTEHYVTKSSQSGLPQHWLAMMLRPLLNLFLACQKLSSSRFLSWTDNTIFKD